MRGCCTEMITGLNVRQVENGYFVNYWEDGKAKDRVFLQWSELCDWMLSRIEAQAR